MSLSRRELLVFSGLLLAGCRARGRARECRDLSGLGGDDVEARNAIQYVGRAPDLDRACERCVQYVAPESGDVCGTCRVVPGPIAPSGTCKVFAKV
jgi:hypothetical protein